MTASGLIDIHSHVAPMALPGDPGSIAPWPCMHCKSASEATLMLGDKPFRELDDRSWSVDRRREDMDRDGVAVQALSPMPELLSYWQSGEHAEHLADHVNAAIAEMVALDPARFRGLGMVPLHEPDRAVRYMATLKTRFGLDGIEIGSNIVGVLPGDTRFDPVFAIAEDQGLAIFIHALHPVATVSVMQDMPFFAPLVGFPLDTAMAGASLILNGVLDRYPGLRIALSHGGGALATLIGRLDQGWLSSPALQERSSSPPREQARRLFYDSNVYDPRLLRYLATEVAPGQICVGTDYPYLIMQKNPAEFIASAELPDNALQALSRETALRFLA